MIPTAAASAAAAATNTTTVTTNSTTPGFLFKSETLSDEAPTGPTFTCRKTRIRRISSTWVIPAKLGDAWTLEELNMILGTTLLLLAQKASISDVLCYFVRV